MSPTFEVLPRLVLDPQWLLDHPAFNADEPYLVRAAFRLIHAAYVGDPPGSIDADVSHLAEAAGLTQEQVARHLDVLTHGFCLRDGRFFHEPMAQLLNEIEGQFHDELQKLRQAALVESLGLNAKKRRKNQGGLRLLPEDFALTQELRSWLAEQGFDAWQQDWLFNGFCDYARSKKPKFADWDAAFRNNVSMKVSKGDRIPPRPGAEPISRGRGSTPFSSVIAAQSAQALNAARDIAQQRHATSHEGQAGFTFSHR